MDEIAAIVAAAKVAISATEVGRGQPRRKEIGPEGQQVTSISDVERR